MPTRRLAAILAADVVGYSRLVSADETDALARLSTLRSDVIEPGIAKHSGRLFKVMGDGFLVEFASAVQAVTCAMAIQAETEQEAAMLDEPRKMRLRIGIRVGDVLVEGDDLMGDGVNIAATTRPASKRPNGRSGRSPIFRRPTAGSPPPSASSAGPRKPTRRSKRQLLFRLPRSTFRSANARPGFVRKSTPTHMLEGLRKPDGRAETSGSAEPLPRPCQSAK
jgi:class 3 adenylate cyclase